MAERVLRKSIEGRVDIYAIQSDFVPRGTVTDVIYVVRLLQTEVLGENKKWNMGRLLQ